MSASSQNFCPQAKRRISRSQWLTPLEPPPVRSKTSVSNGARSKKSLTGLIGAVAVIFMFWIGGCGEFFAQKPTELQVERLLSDLSRIPVVPEPNITVPDIYKEPPKILETKDGAKLFYFTRHHTVDKLAVLISNQFPGPSSNPKSPKSKYAVGQSPATNQLIVGCPTTEEANEVLDFLKEVDVPVIQVKIDCLVSELYADLTMDRETTIAIENLFGENITLSGKTIGEVFSRSLTKATLEPKYPDTLLPAFPGAAIRDPGRALIGLKVGYSKENFQAVVDILESRGYLKILMNPKLEVVNGETAQIEAKDFVPLLKEVYKPGELMPYMTTEYQWVIDSLKITPHVFADGFIGLETEVVIGSESTPRGVKQIPIITERRVTIKENRIRQGESLIIGGIRKSEKRDVVRGVPVLKDIPLVGLLFSSKDFEERAKEVIFIITPTISTGGVPTEEILEELREKHAGPEYEPGLEEILTDPFGVGAYTDYVEQQAARAEFERLKAEIEKAEALGETAQIKEKLLETAEKVLKEKAKLAKARETIDRVKQRADKAKADAEKAKADAERAKAEAEKAKAEAQRDEAKARKAKEEAEKAKSNNTQSK